MEVLKKGREQKGWTKKYTCTGKGNKDGGCKASLLVSGSDIYISGYVGGNYLETGDPAFSFKCPECGVITDIKTSDIPLDITRKLIKEKNDVKPSY